MFTMRIFKLMIAVAVLAITAAPVAADWNPGDGHKMHSPQLPDLMGWDVAATQPFTMVADDWQCSQSGPVTEIHIWGSWMQDMEIPIMRFHLEIWSDLPANEEDHSRPLEMLWEKDFLGPDDWVQREWGQGEQGWFNPMTGAFNRPDHQQIWQYNFAIDPADAFVQEEETIYWLVVYADLGFDPDPGAPPNWGWKTSLDHWNDDSVWGEITAQPVWYELLEPPDYVESLDQAFVINGPDEQDLFDWGDAPDQPYPTLMASTGAYHLITGLLMGTTIDPEADGQPTANADGDDLNGATPDDEDGVTFLTPLNPGATAQVDVFASGTCMLDAWIDFNGNGAWDHPAEHLWGGPSVSLAAGPNTLPFTVPGSALLGQTFARFRISTAGSLPPTGYAPDGEVEDYEVFIEVEELLDFGDAPDQPYPTLLVSNGARHMLDGVTFMGAQVDAEPNGQPDGTATGDDVLDGNDDEDGVTWLTPLIPGFSAQVDVFASAPGGLDAWIDFDGNGTWTDVYDQVFLAQPLVPGPNILTFTVPTGLSAAGTFARFRFSTGGGLGFTGLATDGEVEDYEVFVEDPIHDWGDAPDPFYPTLSASTGAVHTLVEAVYLGSAPADGELDGQQDPIAAGDDVLDGNDDEEGVVHIPDSLEPTGTVEVNVTASTTGYLNGWVDFDANGSWLDTGEQVFTNQPLVSGVNALSFTVPAGAVTPTFTRYRFDTLGGGLGVTGPATDGEVEDHYLRDRAIFSDGFETGNTSAWDVTFPSP